MVFLGTFACVAVLTLALWKPIHRYSGAFYAGAFCVDVLYVLHSVGLLDLPWMVWRPMFELVQECTLALALFSVVMFIGVFPRDNALAQKLRSVRGELSIIAWILSLGHVFSYLGSYVPRMLGGSMTMTIGLSLLVAFALLVLLMLLGVTSFKFIKRRMDSSRWSAMQKWSYVFYGLVYVHLMLLLLPSALSGGIAAQQSVVVYTLVFMGYAIARIYRYRAA